MFLDFNRPEALIFLVTFLYQDKKVTGVWGRAPYKILFREKLYSHFIRKLTILVFSFE
jgi:hypothetical protein